MGVDTLMLPPLAGQLEPSLPRGNRLLMSRKTEPVSYDVGVANGSNSKWLMRGVGFALA